MPKIEIHSLDLVGINNAVRAKTLRQLFHRRDSRSSPKVKILKNIDLNVVSGERLGIVGENGSGKSSLLKVICGIYPPDCGTVNIEGSIAPIIEMGLGFDFELSALENIRLSLLMTRNLLNQPNFDQKAKQILAFAGLINKAKIPIKYFSSGMLARLAFSVVIHQNAEIIILDEIFAVGDVSFQRKSTKLMHDVIQKSDILIIVNHNSQLLREICTRVIWLEDGILQMDGEPNEVINAYEKKAYSTK